MRTFILAPSLLALWIAPVAAQNLDLDKVGGGLGATLQCPIHGQPNEVYALVVDIIEQQTTLPALGVTLDITDQQAWLTFNIPSFLGMTNGNGDATPSVVMPNIPGGHRGSNCSSDRPNLTPPRSSPAKTVQPTRFTASLSDFQPAKSPTERTAPHSDLAAT